MLSSIDKDEADWIEPGPYHICKISKGNIRGTNDPNIKIVYNLVKNCFTDSCDNTESLNLDNIIGKSELESRGYTSFDDARVSQAILEGNTDYLKTYIRKYKHVNNNLTHNNYGDRLLHKAAESNNSKSINLLLVLKPDINIKNTHGHTPLHVAAKHNNFDHAEKLIKLGAELKHIDNNGDSALFHALKNGNLEITRLIFSSE